MKVAVSVGIIPEGIKKIEKERLIAWHCTMLDHEELGYELTNEPTLRFGSMIQSQQNPDNSSRQKAEAIEIACELSAIFKKAHRALRSITYMGFTWCNKSKS